MESNDSLVPDCSAVWVSGIGATTNVSLASPIMKRLVVWSMAVAVVSRLVFEAYRRWYFPRDPARTIPRHARVVAPADGRVIYLERVSDGIVPIAIKRRTEIPLDEIIKGEGRPPAGTLVGIFLSPYDVHYQRSPIAGTIGEVTYHPAENQSMGDMFVRNLFRMERRYANSPHIYENERNVIRIEGDEMSALVVQIADQQVNRIDCYISEGDRVEIGQKIGMIRWGSQVDVFVPGLDPTDFSVAVGDKLKAGETALVE